MRKNGPRGNYCKCRPLTMVAAVLSGSYATHWPLRGYRPHESPSGSAGSAGKEDLRSSAPAIWGPKGHTRKISRARQARRAQPAQASLDINRQPHNFSSIANGFRATHKFPSTYHHHPPISVFLPLAQEFQHISYNIAAIYTK